MLKSLLPLACLVAAAPALAGEIAADRQAELENMLIQDCGSCHGLTMKGGLGSPLTPEALATREDDDLIDTILHGRPGTAMPPWQPLLKREEAAWMVGLLREGVAQ